MSQVALTIRLLGPPAIERDGRSVRPPRRSKEWALLAYLLLAEHTVSRQHLAELLFATAEHPMGALRRALSDLRRVLGAPHLLRGDPVEVSLGDAIRVDVNEIDGKLVEFDGLLELGGQLLEGISVHASPEFDSWLAVERHRLSAAVEARLRHAAIALLAAKRPAAAVPYASRAVARDPLNEGNHVLLIRSLASSGDRDAALEQLAACEDMLRRELGVEPSAAVREAAAADRTGSPARRATSDRAIAASQLEAGRSAIAAGAVEIGIDSLRSAVDWAASSRARELQARALLALGGALIHSVRGRDEEGAVALQEAVLLARHVGDRPTAVAAYRELGFVEVQAGRRASADAFLSTACELAHTDDEVAAVLAIRGMNASDMGDYPAAFGDLQESIGRAAKSAAHGQEAWSLSMLGRAHLLRGEDGQAGMALNDALVLVRQHRWTAFLPWPQSLKAELDLRAGRLTTAAAELERAWSLANRLADPCWEAMAARGLGLLNHLRGDRHAAGVWFAEALERSNRVSNRYRWVHAYVLDARIGTDGDDDETTQLVDALTRVAVRCELRELVVRAHLHKHRLGDPSALPVARGLAAGIDNPALRRVLEEAWSARVEASHSDDEIREQPAEPRQTG